MSGRGWAFPGRRDARKGDFERNDDARLLTSPDAPPDTPLVLLVLSLRLLSTPVAVPVVARRVGAKKKQRDDREPPAATSRFPPFLAPRATGGSPSFNPLFDLAYAPFPATSSPVPSGARAPPPTPLAPTPASPAPDADAGAREPAARGVTRSALVGYLVDPFDKDAFEARVAQARASFDFSDRAVRVHAGSAALEAVERATKAKGARPARAGRGGGGGGLRPAGPRRRGVPPDRAAGAGADAVVFEGERVPPPTTTMTMTTMTRGAFALKVQRASLATWEWVVSERLASRVPAWAAPGFVRLSALHLVGGAGSSAAAAASARVGVAAMPFGEHGTLQDALNSYLRVGERMDEVLVMYYAVELLRVVENLHAAGFLHADIKPDNVLLRNGGDAWRDWAGRRPGCWREKGVALIDFGCAVDLAQYDACVAFVGDVGTEGFRCAEMVEGRPWTFQCDTHQQPPPCTRFCTASTCASRKSRRYAPAEPSSGTGGATVDVLRRSPQLADARAGRPAAARAAPARVRGPPRGGGVRAEDPRVPDASDGGDVRPGESRGGEEVTTEAFSFFGSRDAASGRARRRQKFFFRARTRRGA